MSVPLGLWLLSSEEMSNTLFNSASVGSSRSCARLLAFSVVLMLVAAGCSRSFSPAVAVVPTVIVQKAAPAAAVEEWWNGSVRTRGQASLAFPVGGRLKRVLVEVGDSVEAGAVLAELDQEAFALELDQAEAEARAASPALAEARRRREAEERLALAGAVSRSDLDAAVSAYAAAASRVQAAEAALGLARRQMRESRLVAPSAGRIAQRLAQPATWVAPGTPVLEFDAAGPVEVVLAVPAARLAGVAVGQDVRVRARLTDAAPAIVAGRITHIGQRSLAGGVHEVLVRLSDDAKAFPGEAVQASFARAGTADGVRLPLTAVLPSGEDGMGYVFVVDESSQLARRKVRYASPQGAEVRVHSGLAAGQPVVVAGAAFLRDGQSVRVQLRE